jgi:hypothetical protein
LAFVSTGLASTSNHNWIVARQKRQNADDVVVNDAEVADETANTTEATLQDTEELITKEVNPDLVDLHSQV